MNRILLAVVFVISSWVSYAQPSMQASNITVTPIGNGTSLRFDWGNGNGANRIVIVRTGVYSPVDGTAAPSSDPDFNMGGDLDPGAGIAKCVFNSVADGGGTTVTVTNLVANTVYAVQVFEYNGSGVSTLYNRIADSNNPLNFQSFISSGTFNQPSGVTKVAVLAWGGGGGGGGADSNTVQNRAGGGGGGGTYTFNSNVTIAGNQAIIIGGGGAGGDGTDTPENGASGGTTTFGAALVSAIGGAGGALGNGTDRTGNGAAAATGTTANGGAGGEAPPGGTSTNATGSGAGGASGGPGGNGNSASGGTAGAAVAGSGAGAPGSTVSPPTNGNNATQLGGGGSGGWDNLQNDNGGNGANGGNGFRGQAIVTWTGPPVPSITISGPTPTTGTPVFQVVFSTPINTGSFTGADVTLTGTATGTLVAGITEIAPNNGTTFTITVTGMTGTGTVIANIAAGTLQDVSGNNNLISNAGTTINYTHDTTGPTVTISVSGPDPTNADPIFQVLFDEPINIITFTPGDVTLTGTAGATTAVITEITPNDGTTFTVTASGMTGSGTVIADIAAGLIEDLAATPNTNSASNAGTSITYDNIAPTVVLNDDHPDNIVRDADNVLITAVFTEANGIAGTPTISIGTIVTNAPMSDGPLSWTYLWNVPAGNNGSHPVSISATDVAGNPNAPATAGTGSTSYTIDNIAPVISATAPTSGSSVGTTQLSYTLSENVVSGSITWANTGGTTDPNSPHVQALTGSELNSGAKNNIVLTNNPTLVNGAVYTMSFNANDAAGNPAITVNNTNITFETATSSSIIPISTPISISSLKNSSGNSANVLQFSIFDDGQDPILPNVMSLELNGTLPEVISFTLREPLTLADGASVTGFTSSPGSIASAIYTAATNKITLTSSANGSWNTGTTISYSASTGNAQFVTLGKMQQIDTHSVSIASQMTQIFTMNGSFLVPPGVTQLIVEAWGAGGAGGAGVGGSFWDGGGGGGGGAYSRSVLTVIPGNSYNYTVGSGGFGLNGTASDFDGLVIAPGGFAGQQNTGGTAGAGGPGGPLGTGDIRFQGGSGRSGFLGISVPPPFGFGGGGGSSAGSTFNGTNATGSQGAVAPFEGGNGGSGIDIGIGTSGSFPGGGAGGSGNGSGGAGAGGRIRITYTDSAPIPDPSDWDADTSPFKFSELVITQGAGNSAALSDWQDIIAGAELFDGTNTITGGDVTINPANITFSNIPSTTNTHLGFIDDANGAISFKAYTIRIWLRDDLDPTLAASVDNLFLAFSVDPIIPANITYDDVSNGQLSSRLISTHQSVESGGKQIDVIATQLDFSTNPNPTQFVQQPIASPSAAPDFSTSPVVRARDENGNTDLNFGGTITLASAITLSPTAATMTNGVVAFSAPQYQGAGNGQLTASTGGLANGISSAVTVNFSNTSTIIPGTLPTPTTIASTSTGSLVQVFDFAVVDDGGSGGDGSPMRISEIEYTQGTGNDIGIWSDAIAQAQLFDGVNPPINGTIGTNTITFTGINTAGLGFVADNATKNYQLSIRLRSSMGGTLPDDIDNRNFVFEVLDDNITLSALSSLFTGSEGITSGPSNIAVDVDAIKLQFDTNPATNLLLAKDIFPLQLPVPIVEALDVNNNRDLDYNSTTITVSNSGGLIMTNLPANNSIASGLLTFPPNFQFISGTGNNITLNVGATGPSPVSNAISTTFNVQTGVATTISSPSAPATISSLETNSGAPFTVFSFNVNDDPGGTLENNNDGLPTLLTSVVITANLANNSIANWTQAIAGARLEDGTNGINATTISANSITFSGLSTTVGTLGYVADNATKTYSLKIYLHTALGGTLPTTIDGLQFEFQVLQSNITLAANSTGIIALQSATSGDNVVVDVDATSLRFLNPTLPLSASLNTDIPGISVEAVDVNNNRDIDITGASGTVRELSNPAGATMTNAPIVNTTQFTAGLLNFASTFKYTTGTNGDIVTLTIKAGTGTTCFPGGAICATSPLITLQSSFESSIVADPTFSYSPTLAYVNHQEPTNIQNTATSLEIGRMLLVDGSRTFPFTFGGFPLATGTDTDGLPNSDQDGASTVLNSIIIRISNPSNLRRLALYSGTTEIGTEINIPVAHPSIDGTTPFFDFTFSGSPLLTALDDNIAPISIRASFRDTAPEVTDGEALNIEIISATLGTGSGFFNSPPNIAGQNPAFASPLGFNIINVLATKLDFVSQPAAFAGINRAVTVGSVEAHDQLGLLDTDFSSAAILSAAVPVNGAFAFVSGVLDMSAMQYGSPGDGTITVSAGGLTSDVNNTVGGLPNVADQCTQVDVLHVTTSYTDGGPGGVVTSPNLVGGTSNKVVFGFKFNAPHTVTGPNHPLVSKFRITFSQPTAGVFLNMRVFESTSSVFSLALPDVTTTPGTTVSQPTPNTLEVDFGGSPRDLVVNPDLSYFLMVDIDISASGSTPQMTISVIDDNVESSATDNNIVVSNGTSFSNTFSPVPFTFAATFPPSLVSAYPAVGQSNIDPNQPQIELTFSVPVWTLDGKITLHDKTNPMNPSIELLAANGQFMGGAGTVEQPIIFNIPPGTLVADNEYFITIAQGNRTNLTGIMDDSENLFPGISFSGTLFFKTSDNTPPLLLGASTVPAASSGPTITDITPTGAVLNATFDRNGRAYFMVLASNTTPPTNDQIRGTTAYTASPVIARGDFFVNSSNPISQFGVIAPIAGTFAAGTHYVWMYAEAFSENNRVLTPIPTIGPYGPAPGFAAGAGLPSTLTFVAPGVPKLLNVPNITICANSFQILNSPIIISELGSNQFNAGPTTQTLNMVLPTGFQFDVTGFPVGSTTPKFGTLTLQGADFVPGSGSLSFLGNSILTIQYRNNGAASFDKIIISGLRVIASGSNTGNIFRLGGNALTGAILDGAAMATLSSFNAPFIDFDNSYSTIERGSSQPGAVITSIPDNAQIQSVELSPYITPGSSDFGPSSFSGTGVNVNILNLSAVTLDVPFNITITHTDQNGCISNNAVQYLVYDHNTAVNITDAMDVADQGPYCSTNTNFVVDAITSPTYGQVVRKIDHDNLPSHFMETLAATIPAGATQIINATDFGGAWVPIIQGLPELVLPLINIGGIDYRSYTFDEAEILDANAISGGAIPDPYSNFRQVTPFQLNTYYTGGSLGLVEFQGVYRNSSNTTVQVPRFQLVEFFLPAVPIVELGLANRSALDTADPLNQVGSGGPSNTGTPIFCQEGGLIAINGFPAATAGFSTGSFTLMDAATNTPIVTGALLDNSNGTANLDPSLFATTYVGNPYQDIRIIYTYKEDDSPCESTGSQVIRITPNPVASYTTGLLCEDIDVQFTDGSTIDPAFSIVGWSWNFGDPNSASNTSSDQNPIHLYDQPGTFPNVSLQVNSNFGCLSTNPLNMIDPNTVEPTTQDLIVGGTPAVSFIFSGVSTADDMTFNSTSTVFANSTITNVDWNFGDLTPIVPSANLNNVLHQYTAPGIYDVNAFATSGLGCTADLTQQIVMVDKFTPTDVVAYEEDFEADNGNWQLVAEPGFAGTVSWAWGAPSTSVITNPINGANVWTTNLSGSYSPLERSYLYTTCFDMTQLLRPMISFNSVVQLAAADGVVVEYSTDIKNITDPTKVWTLLGDFNLSQSTGVDWYNALGLASKPGDQVTGDYGWSGSDNTQWMESKHILDEINSPTPQANVVFRFGLASVNTQPSLDGFAMDNIRIGNRTRTIVVENFTNKANPQSGPGGEIREKFESDNLKMFNPGGVGTRLVKINYHVGFPATDPFNLDNPADPSSRALYYNITQTPLTRLDGFKNPGPQEAFFSAWGNQQYGVRTLQLAQAELSFDVTNNADDGSLQVDVEVNPKIELDANTRLHVAILEKNIPIGQLSPSQSALIATGESDFEFVLKKMLPSALGTRFDQVAPAGQVRNFGPFNWYPEAARMYAPDDDLAVIVFLQNEDTKEILQSEIMENITDPPLVTGITRDITSIENVAIYPNPADDEITVELPSPAANRMRLLIASQLGVIANDTAFEPGEQKKTISTKDLAAGIYFLQLGNGQNATRKKVMIVHR